MPKSFCAVSFCTSKSGSGVSLHTFPRDEPRRQKWIEFVRACGRQEYQDWSPVQNSRVCWLHFEAHCFTTKAPDLAYSTSVFRLDPVHRSRLVLYQAFFTSADASHLSFPTNRSLPEYQIENG